LKIDFFSGAAAAKSTFSANVDLAVFQAAPSDFMARGVLGVCSLEGCAV
jgi:hypothetical protein